MILYIDSMPFEIHAEEFRVFSHVIVEVSRRHSAGSCREVQIGTQDYWATILCDEGNDAIIEIAKEVEK